MVTNNIGKEFGILDCNGPPKIPSQQYGTEVPILKALYRNQITCKIFPKDVKTCSCQFL
jgi:hypothetical protein